MSRTATVEYALLRPGRRGSRTLLSELNGGVYTYMPSETFEALQRFIDSGDERIREILTYNKKSDYIKLKNYVGMISLDNGDVIEIFPKTYNYSAEDKESEARKYRMLIAEMLGLLEDLDFARIDSSGAVRENFDLLEGYIRVFIDEVFPIVKRGLRNNYSIVRENRGYLKGKPCFSEQLRDNLFHPEKFVCEYDEFGPNRPENRIIKAALDLLSRKTKSPENSKDLKILLNCFSEVPKSADFRLDLSRIVPDRNTRDHKTALELSGIFLNGASLSAYRGGDSSMALLYPMETLYEKYAAELFFRKSKDFIVEAQVWDMRLFDRVRYKNGGVIPESRNNTLFKICPDLVLTSKKSGKKYILDTKWKLLDENLKNFGISSEDMYQMYVYGMVFGKKYDLESVTLLYPASENKKGEFARGVDYGGKDGLTVRVRFIDIFNAEKSVEEIIGELEQ